MPTLILEFPAGRYHATPWGHHVNEGLIEWPPSPWRLLRALLATGYSTLHWPAEGPPPVARGLIEKLSSVLPTYVLPKAIGTHSRHYMPMARFKNGREETSLVFDTWARVNGVIAVNWDVDLSPDEHDLFVNIAERMGYLGRSESWVNARVVQTNEVVVEGEPCWPEGRIAPSTPGWEQIPLLTPVSATDYAQWRNQAITQATEGLEQPAPGKKLGAKARKQWEKAIRPYPTDLLDCLQIQSNELQEFGWSQPPGSRRVFYWRAPNALEVGPPRAIRPGTIPPVEAILVSMATQSSNSHALPSATRTLPQAELLHRALVSLDSRINGKPSRVLTGCDENGRPLREPHVHAHLLPLDLDEDGHLDHVLIWAPMQLDGAAQRAVRAVRSTFTKGGIAPLRLAIAGSGDLAGLRELSGSWGDSLRRVLGPAEGATEWLSMSPFVPPRYLKRRGRNTLEGQVIAELASRGLPEPTDMRVLEPRDDDRARRQRHYIRSRRRGPAAPNGCGFTLALRFSDPIAGPLCLGYGSHFGLGLFEAAVDD